MNSIIERCCETEVATSRQFPATVGRNPRGRREGKRMYRFQCHGRRRLDRSLSASVSASFYSHVAAPTPAAVRTRAVIVADEQSPVFESIPLKNVSVLFGIPVLAPRLRLRGPDTGSLYRTTATSPTLGYFDLPVVYSTLPRSRSLSRARSLPPRLSRRCRSSSLRTRNTNAPETSRGSSIAWRGCCTWNKRQRRRSNRILE